MKRIISCIVFINFALSCVMPPQGFAQTLSAVGLMPQPGTQVSLSTVFNPAHLKGMVIHPTEPFKFDFIVNRGDTPLTDDQKQAEYSKLIKYFLASLAVPDTDQWVNLSPYEKDRIIPDNFGMTEMGRDLLAQDYFLKQISASLTNPDTDLGKKFWDGVYAAAYQKFGSTDIPTDTFNKVWIIPDKAVVYEKGNAVYVIEHHLKVMMESDYRAMKENADQIGTSEETEAVKISKQVMREIIIPAIEKEVNEGENFAPLRQVASGMLLATWYKMALKETILGRLYADRSKVKGVDQDPKNNQEIYTKYVEAFQKGVFNMIKEDVDQYSQEIIPRKYFSGGAKNDYAEIMKRRTDSAAENKATSGFVGDDVIKVLVKDPAGMNTAVEGGNIKEVVQELISIANDPALSLKIGESATPEKDKELRTAVQKIERLVKGLKSKSEATDVLTAYQSNPSHPSRIGTRSREWVGYVIEVLLSRAVLNFEMASGVDRAMDIKNRVTDNSQVGSDWGQLKLSVGNSNLNAVLMEMSKTMPGNLEVLKVKAQEIVKYFETRSGELNDVIDVLIHSPMIDGMPFTLSLGKEMSFTFPEGNRAGWALLIVEAILNVGSKERAGIIEYVKNFDPAMTDQEIIDKVKQEIAQWLKNVPKVVSVMQELVEVVLNNSAATEKKSIAELALLDVKDLVALIKREVSFVDVDKFNDETLMLLAGNGASRIAGFLKKSMAGSAASDASMNPVESMKELQGRLLSVFKGFNGVVSNDAFLVTFEAYNEMEGLLMDFPAQFVDRNGSPYKLWDIVGELFDQIQRIRSHKSRLDATFKDGMDRLIDDLKGLNFDFKVTSKNVDKAGDNEYGGIDLAQSNLDLQIRRDGNGVPLPVAQQNLENIKIDGLVPEILSIVPASSVKLF